MEHTEQAGQHVLPCVPKLPRAYKEKWEAINSGVVGERFIRGMAKALNAGDRRARGYSTSMTATKLSSAQLQTLLEMVQTEKPRIEPGQAAKGLAYLMDHCWTPKGKLRASCNLSGACREHLASYTHFTLEGFSDAGGNCAYYLPIYRVHGKTGSFSYTMRSWQAGGSGPEVYRAFD